VLLVVPLRDVSFFWSSYSFAARGGASMQGTTDSSFSSVYRVLGKIALKSI